jgi:adenine deaminase
MDAALDELRTRLAELVRAGLPRDAALKAVTLNAAKLLGIQDRLGTVEKGKDADLIFLDGDPLGPETRVTRVMIGGDIVWEAPKRQAAGRGKAEGGRRKGEGGSRTAEGGIQHSAFRLQHSRRVESESS